MRRYTAMAPYAGGRALDLWNEWPFFNAFAETDRFLKTDIKDEGDSYLLQCEIPGVDKKEIHVNIEGDLLSIRVERDEKKEEKDDTFLRRERVYGSCSRSFEMTGIDADKVTGQYSDGILSLRLPRRKEFVNGAKRINIA